MHIAKRKAFTLGRSAPSAQGLGGHTPEILHGLECWSQGNSLAVLVRHLISTSTKQRSLRECHLVERHRLSQNPYLDSKKLLQEMAERYEEMFAQYHAIRTVFSEEAKTNASLLAKYAEVLLATNFQGDVHSKFLPLYAAIAELSEEADIPALLSRIPQIPKVS